MMTDKAALPGFKPRDLPDLTGTKAVVTGANSGIGFHTAAALAEHGAEVVLACRNTDAALEAAKKISGVSTVEKLDLASQTSIHEFVARFDGSLDLLVNNAGVMTPPKYRETPEGHELQFGTNHLGHFALTGLLLPALLKSESPRVVTVASIAHHRGDESVLEGNPEASYEPQKAYGNSKLANLLFARELHRRTSEAGVKLTSTAAHPGVSATGLVEDRNGMGANPVIHRLAPYFMPLIFQSSSAGANPTLYAATYGEPGSYVGPTRLGESRGKLGEAKMSRHARNDDLASKLWELSEEKTGVRFDFSA
jgi:NAD(P)-dependent dehydrogenase (short-subunit alcohol dehydrogenase family)